MAKKVQKLLAGALALVTCLPLAACGSGVSVDGAEKFDPPAYESATGTDGSEHTVPNGVGGIITPDASATADTPVSGTAADDPVIDAEWIDWLAQLWADGSSVAAPDTYVRTNNADGTLSVEISDAKALAFFSHDVYANADDFIGAEVKLTADIDLQNKLWIPIGFDTRATDSVTKQDIAHGETFNGLPHSFKGTFDAGIYEANIDVPVGNHKISGLNGAKFIDAIIEDAGELYVAINNEVKVVLPHNADPEFHYGLFGSVGNATFKNLTVTDFTFDFSECDVTLNGKALIADSIGAIAGYSAGSLTVENCIAGTERRDTNGNLIRTADVRGVACAGGLVGRAYPGYHTGAWGTEFGKDLKIRLDDGSLDFQKNASGQPVDGKGNVITDPTKIVYYADSAAKQAIILDNCTNYLNLGADQDIDKKAGIVGYAYWMVATIFENCANYGDMHGTDIGGITSYTQDSGMDIRYVNCVNYGDIYQYNAGGLTTADAACNVGGIVGRINNTPNSIVIEKCVNYGDVYGGVVYAAGGVIGKLQMDGGVIKGDGNRIVDCFNYGTVTVANQYIVSNSTADSKKSRCGGVIGFLDLPKESVISFGNCGDVIGEGYVGGCIGSFNNMSVSHTQVYMINANSNIAKKVGNQ